MTSTKEDGAAATAEQLGSLSLGESAESKENDTEPTSKDEAPTNLCSACGKKSDAVKLCSGCKCVWYCDKKCQNKHRKEHKKECKRITAELDKRGGELDLGEELDIGPLGKLPPREECPICMRVLPIRGNLHRYFACCGKTICAACDHQHLLKNEELALPQTCAFCRTAVPQSDDDFLAQLVQLRKRVDRKDPEALLNMALNYGNGWRGLTVDHTKCVELLRQSADLGCPAAQFNLGIYHHVGEMGLEPNEEKAVKYWEKAAEGGHIIARHNFGCTEEESGDDVAAMRHLRLAASVGYRLSMEGLIACFEDRFLHHADLAETLQAMYRARAEMKSEGRDEYIAKLKKTGKYKAEYED